MPRVTVIISTYNWATVLPYSIGSVLDQTFPDFELLVVGDGCTDESGEVVTAIDDSRVQWHNLPANTKHQSGPNNEGLRLARGAVIAYLGHDDLWLPQHLEVLLEALDAGAVWATASLLSVAPYGRPTIWPDATAIKMQAAADGKSGARTTFTETMSKWVAPCSIVHDRAPAIEIGGWRPLPETGALAPPADFWNRMAAVAGPPRRVNRITSVKMAAASRRDVYRQRPSHEQAHWLQRIRDSDDPEESIRRASNEDYVFAGPEVPTGLPVAFNSPGLTESADEYLRRVRKYKGLDD